MSLDAEAALCSLEHYTDYLRLLARLQIDPRSTQSARPVGHSPTDVLVGTRSSPIPWPKPRRNDGLAAQNPREHARRGHWPVLPSPAGTRAILGKRHRGVVGPAGGMAGPGPVHSQPEETRSEQLAILARALAGLPADPRRALELHHFQGLSVAETAGGWKDHRVGHRLVYRGAKALRGSMGSPLSEPSTITIDSAGNPNETAAP